MTNENSEALQLAMKALHIYGPPQKAIKSLKKESTQFSESVKELNAAIAHLEKVQNNKDPLKDITHQYTKSILGGK